MKKSFFTPLVFFIVSVAFFFQNVFIHQQLPIPSDTIVGLYHPFRDAWAKQYPNGIPFKNFLITDPVRQQYPWKELVIHIEKSGEMPLWNPYSFAGTPLLANFQSAPFYPFNVVLMFLSMQYGWGFFILAQMLMAGCFLYIYLRNLGINLWASVIGALTFSFSGFSIAWLEWGTVIHTALWLPIILFAIDKIFAGFKRKEKTTNSFLLYIGILLFSLISSFFAGHLQTFFYLFFIVCSYLFLRFWQNKESSRLVVSFLIAFLIFGMVTSVQWLPTYQFITESARSIDQAYWQREGWFLPVPHLLQFIVPDFFGNPSTLNYWGVWNYAELIGYVGILPLIMAFYSIFFRRDKETAFFTLLLFTALIFALPTIFAKIPYLFSFPFISTAQPTRLLFVIDFSLAVLCSFGIDAFLKERSIKKIFVIAGCFMSIFFVIWIYVILGNDILQLVSKENIEVTKRNLFLPTALLITSSFLLLIYSYLPRKFHTIFYILIITLVSFDVIRFGQKFTPFTDSRYLFPSTKTLTFLQENTGNYRIMSVDSRILPPNFSVMYRLQDVGGYDPLFIQRYAELVAASERGKPDISPPFGFNRIITPHRFDSKIIDLLGVKYILSLSELSSPKLKKVFQEGQTRVYENINAFPRAFFVESGGRVLLKEQAMTYLFKKDVDLRRNVVIEDPMTSHIKSFSIGKAEIIEYSENRVIIKTTNLGDGLLILTDSFYPTWKAIIDEQQVQIYRADYNFRGIFVPRGTHTVEFYNTLL